MKRFKESEFHNSTQQLTSLCFAGFVVMTKCSSKAVSTGTQLFISRIISYTIIYHDHLEEGLHVHVVSVDITYTIAYHDCLKEELHVRVRPINHVLLTGVFLCIFPL